MAEIALCVHSGSQVDRAVVGRRSLDPTNTERLSRGPFAVGHASVIDEEFDTKIPELAQQNSDDEMAQADQFAQATDMQKGWLGRRRRAHRRRTYSAPISMQQKSDDEMDQLPKGAKDQFEQATDNQKAAWGWTIRRRRAHHRRRRDLEQLSKGAKDQFEQATDNQKAAWGWTIRRRRAHRRRRRDLEQLPK